MSTPQSVQPSRIAYAFVAMAVPDAFDDVTYTLTLPMGHPDNDIQREVKGPDGYAEIGDMAPVVVTGDYSDPDNMIIELVT